MAKSSGIACRLGGAPFNVVAPLVQLAGSASLVSSIGQDSLGEEILKVAQDKRVNTEFVTRARIGLATGTVLPGLREEQIQARQV